jgi:hypothetical protein
MRNINCCVCLEDNVCHYTQEEEMKTKCEHPVCRTCYFQLPQAECPLCRMSISSLLLDIQKAIFHVSNVRYEELFRGFEYILYNVTIRRVGNNYFHYIENSFNNNRFSNYHAINDFEYNYDRVFINDDSNTDDDYADDDYTDDGFDDIEYDRSYSYWFANNKREIEQYYYLHDKHIEKNINIEEQVCAHICA